MIYAIRRMMDVYTCINCVYPMYILSSIPSLYPYLYPLYIGPCQFPTLGFVVEQYLKVLRFRPEPFWYLDLQIAKDDETNKFTWKRNHLFDRLITLILYEKSIEMSGGQARIVKVEEANMQVSPFTA